MSHLKTQTQEFSKQQDEQISVYSERVLLLKRQLLNTEPLFWNNNKGGTHLVQSFMKQSYLHPT